jgi:hypothetical protein
MVGRLNRLLRGWANYFCFGTVTRADNRVTAPVCYRLRRWLMRKHGVRRPQWSRYADQQLHDTLGFLRLRRRPLNPSCANG